MKIRIITESASDIVSPHRQDVTVLPLTVSFGDEEFEDGVTITHAQFYDKLEHSDIFPTTSLISPGRFAEAFAAAVAAGESVIAITMSSKLSGTHHSAVTAAQDYAGSVYVVDSESAAVGERILILYALRLIDEGRDIKEIVFELERAKKRLYLVALLDTLEYLQKGGRIPKGVAYVGELLSIKPVITVRDGEVSLLGSARGSKNGNNFLIKEVGKAGGIDFSMPFYLAYSGSSDKLLNRYI